MKDKNRLIDMIKKATSDETFLHWLERFENFVAKVLTLALVLVIFVSVIDLTIFLTQELTSEPIGFFNRTLIEIFGIFLNILVALEILENITGYLRKHIFQVELVIGTALIAVARKIIIFDLNKYSSEYLTSLGISVLAIAVSYWIVKRLRQ
jgi:uncharacterized membrane protein (DUF373 family)